MPLKSDLIAPLLFDMLLMTDDDTQLMKRKFYSCDNRYHYYVTVKENTNCPSCFMSMTRDLQFVGLSKVVTGSEILQGILGKSATYMVTDDLCVTPVSMISGAKFLQKNVKDINVLEETVVDIENDEVLQLLEAPFQSNATLTNVFIVNKERERERESERESWNMI
ncbi:hypothetical protein Patl1_06274 [Pistacia atlantica]|uniref:Uncharacterized protein n=1 Tax=Pistacia atlantica TaxID=434234 RepID=A0ACC1BQM8_9ROSI|nr:hypothetical protein Patl1_06274 [Pistacia atlantica]